MKGFECFAWKSLLRGRDVFYRFAKWRVGSGEGVDVWRDNWGPYRVCMRDYYDPSVSRVSDLFQSNPRGWNCPLQNRIFPPWVLRKIQLVTSSSFGRADSLIWPITRTVKSCYNNLVEDLMHQASSSSSPSVRAWKCLWTLQVQPKVRNFV